MKKKMNLEQTEAAIKQWRTKLKRAINMMEKLEKQRKRLEKAASIPASTLVAAVKRVTQPKPAPVTRPNHFWNFMEDGDFNKFTEQEARKPMKDDDLAIPDFLQRKPDPVAEQIKAEQEETKKAKARGRIEKMKAKKRGDLKKMPLTGKAAFEAIRKA